jgi:hypothetical protein
MGYESDVLHGRGVVRVLSEAAGKPGDERDYEVGDDALIENGMAEWVVAPSNFVEDGLRLDSNSGRRAASPLGGVEAFPVASSTDGDNSRDVHARRHGSAPAHDAGSHDRDMAAAHAKAAELVAEDSDAERQASLGSLGARSGPVTARSDLPADKAIAEASNAGDTPAEDKPARTGGSAPKGAGK